MYDDSNAQLLSEIGELGKSVNDFATRGTEKQKQIEARLLELEQKLSRRVGGINTSGDVESWGAQIIRNPELRSLASENRRGAVSTPLETRAIVNLGAAVPADRQPGIVGLPQRKLVIRDLLPTVATNSNTIEFLRQSAFSNAAVPVAENSAKPYSDITFSIATAPVRTLAHLQKVSRQSLDDLPQLQGFIDGQMRYGLGYVEEQQILVGDGTGQNLLGLVPSATPYATARTIAGDTRLDVLAHAISQLADSGYAADGIALNLGDFGNLQLLKASDGTYLGASPWEAPATPRLFGVPVVATPALAAGRFLCGAFRQAATLFDRLRTEVAVSSENATDWETNMLTVRAEERIALAVTQPAGLVTGTFPV